MFCAPRSGRHSCNVDGERLCEDGYYGPLCDVHCVGRNDGLGHYQCSEDGSIVCLEGYQETSSNCTRRKNITPTQCVICPKLKGGGGGGGGGGGEPKYDHSKNLPQ